MRFPSTRRERGGGKKERRESTHTYARTRAAARACMRARVCTRALHGVCTGRKRTYVQKESRELGRETETERERGKRGRQGDGSCVCTTRRVYQATSVVTAIVPTTSPAGRHPRSIRLSSFPSRPPWSLASRRIASVSPPSWKPFHGVFFLVGDDPSYPPLAFIVSSLVLPRFLSLPRRCNKRLYFRARSEFLDDGIPRRRESVYCSDVPRVVSS